MARPLRINFPALSITPLSEVTVCELTDCPGGGGKRQGLTPTLLIARAKGAKGKA